MWQSGVMCICIDGGWLMDGLQDEGFIFDDMTADRRRWALTQ